jgi:hypothetical protein
MHEMQGMRWNISLNSAHKNENRASDLCRKKSETIHAIFIEKFENNSKLRVLKHIK